MKLPGALHDMLHCSGTRPGWTCSCGRTTPALDQQAHDAGEVDTTEPAIARKARIRALDIDQAVTHETVWGACAVVSTTVMTASLFVPPVWPYTNIVSLLSSLILVTIFRWSRTQRDAVVRSCLEEAADDTRRMVIMCDQTQDFAFAVLHACMEDAIEKDLQKRAKKAPDEEMH